MGAGRWSRLRAALLLATTALVSPMLLDTASAQTLPTGGTVAAGNVAISQPSANQLTVNQSSQSAVVNWQGFSVGAGSTVTFVQPNSSSAILNRITGNTPSTIAGAINANGQVYLVNPNGIAITASGTVNTGGGFVASTLGMSDSDFMAGKRTFTGSGASAAVSNAGIITVGRGGYAALIGGTVSNSGMISVPLGKVALGSGEQATLDFSGDGFLQVGMPTAAGGKGALVRNAGTIAADGGSIILSAATAREAARNAINISGVVQARSIGGQNGAIVIGGGDGGRVKISGRVDARSRDGAGGRIAVTGRSIKLKGATVEASGTAGGGTINIGGGRQGTGPLPHANDVQIDAATRITADALSSGDGGNVVVWSDGATAVHGLLSARGGPGGGHGGQIETSGHTVDFAGIRIDASAAQGKAGLWLIDPQDLTVDAAAATTISTVLNGGTDVTLQTTATTASGTGVISNGQGDIIVNAGLSWSSASRLTLDAYNAIAINAPITVAGAGGVNLKAAYDITTAPGVSLLKLSFGNGAGLTYAAGPSGTGITGQSLTINGASYTLVYTMAQLDAIDGYSAATGASIPVYGPGPTGNYALAGNLSAAGTTYTNALIGANVNNVVIGTDGVIAFTGVFTGLGHAIDGLSLAPTASYAGLFGFVGPGGMVRDIAVTNATVIPATSAGPLAGLNAGTIFASSASGNMTNGGGTAVGGLVGINAGLIVASQASTNVFGFANAGGLVGYSQGTILMSQASGVVRSTQNAGGLVGANDGAIADSSASGAVSAMFIPPSGGNAALYGANVGGLVGFNQGSIASSFATGAVTGYNLVGGLLGSGSGSIASSYATGNVTSLAASSLNGSDFVGGLVGKFTTSANSTISDSYATGNVTSTGNYVGGLVGLAAGTSISGSYATGTVSGGGSNVGGLIGQSGQSTVASSYATGAVTAGGSSAGGLIGSSLKSTVSDSYALGNVSGQSSVGGLIGIVTTISDIGFVGAGSTIQRSYAAGTVTGAGDSVGGLIGSSALTDNVVSQSFATGAVINSSSGGRGTGGLMGRNSGTVQDVYATGAVLSAGSMVGGLIGFNVGTVSSGYSTGFVRGAAFVGGFIGRNSGTITSGAFNTGTSGQTTAFGLDLAGQGANVAGLTTAQLQRAGLPAGFDPTIWAGGSGGLYPYIQSFFPDGVQAVSGTAQSAGGAAAAGGQVAVYMDGMLLGGGSASVGANGYYYVAVAAGTLAPTGNKLGTTLTLSGASSVSGLTYTDASALAGNSLDLGVVSSGLSRQTTAQTSYSALQSDLGATFGNSTYAALTTALGSAATTLTLTGASFTLDQRVIAGADYSLISTTAGAPLTIAANGGITSGGAILIAVNGNVINQAGAAALTPGTFFTVYTQNAADPTGVAPVNQFGGLTGTSVYGDAFDFAMGRFASAIPSGNAFVYAHPAPQISLPKPPSDGGLTRPIVVADNFASVTLSQQTRLGWPPQFSAPSVSGSGAPAPTGPGSGALFVDPRFDQPVVCFSGSCYVGH
ncbi:filamentous hemagglutinin N-terminal domain-containing protein [Bradyrhizobium sp. U87765 SZCCT0131]|uniref:beta strand repeat-containing protein n=1 Tax=unclassified Bradyrhizobium TaxID=2631580 RepID=UPI001BABB259|nr:filamentous hemagglutinin N-terminal domain-containing protein [Bradyrhizobium sp. U87765 SZCCT0131]MBR1259628.1 filamentous hemagglutinin N-terminal domain-containing protein [Bradyrhizobium sp. U87765 SZCCT0134]MBR1305769.1 filamentous hemagglutinin N-terminal domain-containing protein [Bradyrhizobium sp. U87765 SZCCT0110]MBR1322136.1 filamentous hemagglutinin N-terminal domain-containing protein [Bradyrhizobium sp. U87765 SZCCT0109]MBR1350586.1 filamentous hemagglutinin N-terminal domain-